MIDVAPLAQALGVPALHLRALMLVECGGPGLLDGLPVIRLEVHRLWSLAHEAVRPAVDEHFHVAGPRAWEGHSWRPTPESGWTPLHQGGIPGQRAEWAAYHLAVELVGADVATRATSWGAGQILGDWHALGYASPTALVEAASSDEGQADMLARYLRARPVLLDALRRGDWTTVATRYNGAGNADEYARRLTLAIHSLQR